LSNRDVDYQRDSCVTNVSRETIGKWGSGGVRPGSNGVHSSRVAHGLATIRAEEALNTMANTSVAVDKAKGVVTITLPIEKRTSKSGKNVLIASTGGGMKTSATFEGKEVTINVSAYVKADGSSDSE
jgi:hypothetical protein